MKIFIYKKSSDENITITIKADSESEADALISFELFDSELYYLEPPTINT